jgi:hypothetical protein
METNHLVMRVSGGIQQDIVLTPYPCDEPPQPLRGVVLASPHDEPPANVDTLCVPVMPTEFYESTQHLTLLQQVSDLATVRQLKQYPQITAWVVPNHDFAIQLADPNRHIYTDLPIETEQLAAEQRRLEGKGVFVPSELADIVQPILPVAELDPTWLPTVPAGMPLSFPVSIINDSSEELNGWTYKISLTAWLPRNESHTDTTFMHHWGHSVKNINISPRSIRLIDEVTIPPLSAHTMQYHLVLQLFNMEDMRHKAKVNSYILNVE